MNRPGFTGDRLVKARGHGWCVQHGIVSFFGLGRRNVSDGLQKVAVVEPVDPFERGELHSFKASPRSAAMDDLGLVKTADRFGESIVVTVANASDRWLDACLGQPFGIANGHVLRAAVGMMNQPATFDGPPIMQCLVEGIEDESRVRRPACPPTDDTAGEGINDEGHVSEALPGRDIGEIGYPTISGGFTATERTRFQSMPSTSAMSWAWLSWTRLWPIRGQQNCAFSSRLA